jgi:hypothetical protein
MAKKFITPIILITLIITGIILSKSYMQKETQEMVELIKASETSVYAGDFERAEKSVNEFSEKWDTNRKVLCTFVRHSEVDIANESAAKIKPYLNAEDKSDFFAECEILKFQIKHISETESYTLYNIF